MSSQLGNLLFWKNNNEDLGHRGGGGVGAVQTRALKGSLFIDWKRWDCSGRLGCCRSPW